MIVAPDFVDHWKTRMLVGLLGDDEVGPVYIIRLWAHCQQRRTSVFESLPTAALRAICRFPGNAEVFESAMVESGFIAREGQSIRVKGWDQYNAALIANWSNGKKGGRPRKAIQPPEWEEPTQTPPETHGFQAGNVPVVHGKAGAKPIREDGSREEKRREPQETIVELPPDEPPALRSPPAVKGRKRMTKPATSIDDVRRVFVHWQTVRDHPQAKLDAKREKNIRARLADGYTAEQLCKAVNGVANSTFHMGDNEQRTVYDDVELICRNAGNVDKFIRLADAPPPNKLSRAGARTAEATKRWLERNAAETAGTG